MKQGLYVCLAALLLIAGITCSVYAEGHYVGGVANIRDFAQPFEKGAAAIVYNPYYHSTEYRDNDAKKLDSFSASRTVRIGDNIVVDATAAVNNIDLDITSYTFNPLLFYFTGVHILGANYGVGVGPSYTYVRTKFEADVAGDFLVNGQHFTAGTHVNLKDSASGFGDLMVRPVMLDWSRDDYDIVTAYQFYAPTGAYDSDDLANAGLGYWSHQAMLGGLWYFNKKATALLCNATYEVNTKKDGIDITPGQNLILEYGISQYLATWLEVGVSGASYFQTTNATGSDASNKSDKDIVHTAAVQMTMWPIEKRLAVVGRYFNQYYAKNTLRGQGANLTVVLIF